MDRNGFIRAMERAKPMLDDGYLEYVTWVLRKTHDDNTTAVISMEEMGELIKEISKQVRKEGDKYNLLQEIADVYISIALLQVTYNITNHELYRAINVKLDRNLSRARTLLAKKRDIRDVKEIPYDDTKHLMKAIEMTKLAAEEEKKGGQ